MLLNSCFFFGNITSISFDLFDLNNFSDLTKVGWRQKKKRNLHIKYVLFWTQNQLLDLLWSNNWQRSLGKNMALQDDNNSIVYSDISI